MPRIVAISDTHNHIDFPIPEGDILIHAGDLTGMGRLAEVSRSLAAFGKLPHPFKVFIAGNHDWLAAKTPLLFKELCFDNGITYLEDSGVTIHGLKIYGSPIQPEFHNWAFNKKRGAQIAKYWSMIPNDTQILVTHGPPYGILDEVENVYNPFSGFEHVGCEELLERIHNLPLLKCHIFGHIHRAYGRYVNNNGVVFVNASICDESYNPVNPVQVIDI